MIKNITYSVTFPTNGISLQGSYDFEPGLTAITGGNGSGKSFGTLEMIRYGFFGKEALRGPASDYSKLHLSMVAEILGEDYTIVRTPKAESVTDASGVIKAVGADAVTKHLRKLLGMSLGVFDVICASVQKESDRLSKLRPAARKQLIDETVGLTANEAVEKACKEEAKGLVREADALRTGLVAPIEPVAPANYLPSASIAGRVGALKADLADRARLQKIIDAVGLQPVEPAAETVVIADLEASEAARLAAAADIAAAERQLKTMPEASYTAEQLDLSEIFNVFRTAVEARGAAPTHTLDEIDAWQTYFEKRAVADRLADIEVECPSCSTSFCPGHELVECPAGDEPTTAQLRAARAANDRWAVPLVEVKTDHVLTAKQIAEGRVALGQSALRAEVLAKTWQKVGDDRSAELRAARQLQAEWKAFDGAYAAWSLKVIAAAEAEAELAKLAVLDEADLDKLQAEFVAASVYESQLEAFQKATVAYDKATAEIEDRIRRADDFKLGAKRLAETRQLFKGHLAPSVSRIASSLIDTMTGGVLSSVIVDEDMNITVNGQDIGTLSGAGSTAANLSVRLALGQVLVKGVIPIFLADEPDSDMEASRAEYAMEGLANLKDKLRQIIVITHKPVKFTDQVISLQSND